MTPPDNKQQKPGQDRPSKPTEKTEKREGGAKPTQEAREEVSWGRGPIQKPPPADPPKESKE